MLQPVWDLGWYFFDTPATAMMVYAHFTAKSPPLLNATEDPATPQHQHPPQQQHQHTKVEEAKPSTKSSAKKRRSTPPRAVQKRARKEKSASGGREVETTQTPVAVRSSEEDEDDKGLFVTPNSASSAHASTSPLSSALSIPSPPTAVSADSAAAKPVTLKFKFENRMGKSHNIQVPAWETEVDGDLLLSDYEDQIKNKIKDTFLCCGDISERQSHELTEALEILVFVENVLLDVLCERKAVAEYLPVADDEAERVLPVKVQMCRNIDVQNHVLSRLSPTLEESEQDE